MEEQPRCPEAREHWAADPKGGKVHIWVTCNMNDNRYCALDTTGRECEIYNEFLKEEEANK